MGDLRREALRDFSPAAAGQPPDKGQECVLRIEPFDLSISSPLRIPFVNLHSVALSALTAFPTHT